MVRGKILALAASALLVAGIGAVNAAPAHAAQQQICTVGGVNNNGDCMNNWFGNGQVYAYLPNKSNEDFSSEPVDRCGGKAVVTSTCPFSNTSMDVALENAGIIQIVYGNGAGCVADPSDSGYASVGTCNSQATGTGGSFASVWVDARNGSLVSVGWTNQEGAWWQLNSNGGSEPLTIFGSSNATEWNLSA
jgi:hypothetical protein